MCKVTNLVTIFCRKQTRRRKIYFFPHNFPKWKHISTSSAKKITQLNKKTGLGNWNKKVIHCPLSSKRRKAKLVFLGRSWFERGPIDYCVLLHWYCSSIKVFRFVAHSSFPNGKNIFERPPKTTDKTACLTCLTQKIHLNAWPGNSFERVGTVVNSEEGKYYFNPSASFIKLRDNPFCNCLLASEELNVM